MDKIYTSASRIVFIMMAVAVIVLTFMRIIDPKDFMILASMSFTYYFTKPGTPQVETKNTNTKIIGNNPNANG